MSPDEIKAFRKSMAPVWAKAQKLELARQLGVSIHTVEDWESGRRNPSHTAVILMRILIRESEG